MGRTKFLYRIFNSVENWRKKNAPDMDQDAFLKLMSVDPTFSGEDSETVGKYGKWLLKQFRFLQKDLSVDTIFRDFYFRGSFKRYLIRYNILLERNLLPKDKRNIDSFDYDRFRNYMAYEGKELYENKVLPKDVEKNTETLYEDDNWLIVSPKTHQASVKWGRGFKSPGENPFSWCTSANSENGLTRFNEHTETGKKPNIIWLSKKNSDIGFNTIAGAGEFRDKDNNRNLSPEEWAGIFPKEALLKVAEYDPWFKHWIGEFLIVDRGSYEFVRAVAIRKGFTEESEGVFSLNKNIDLNSIETFLENPKVNKVILKSLVVDHTHVPVFDKIIFVPDSALFLDNLTSYYIDRIPMSFYTNVSKVIFTKCKGSLSLEGVDSVKIVKLYDIVSNSSFRYGNLDMILIHSSSISLEGKSVKSFEAVQSVFSIYTQIDNSFVGKESIMKESGGVLLGPDFELELRNFKAYPEALVHIKNRETLGLFLTNTSIESWIHKVLPEKSLRKDQIVLKKNSMGFEDKRLYKYLTGEEPV